MIEEIQKGIERTRVGLELLSRGLSPTEKAKFVFDVLSFRSSKDVAKEYTAKIESKLSKEELEIYKKRIKEVM
jgi:hypothetical protein